MDPSAIVNREDVLLGKLLVDAEFLTADQLYDCVELQKMYGDGRPIGRVFVEMGYVAEEELDAVLAIQAEYLEELQLHGWRDSLPEPGVGRGTTKKGEKAGKSPRATEARAGTAAPGSAGAGKAAAKKPPAREADAPGTAALRKPHAGRASAAPEAPRAERETAAPDARHRAKAEETPAPRKKSGKRDKRRKPKRGDPARGLAAAFPVSDRDETLIPDAEGDVTLFPYPDPDDRDTETEDLDYAEAAAVVADAPVEEAEAAPPDLDPEDGDVEADPAGDAAPADLPGHSSISGFYTYKVKGIRAAPLAGGQRVDLASAGGWFSYLLEKAIAAAVVGMAVVMVLLVVLFIRDRFADEPEKVVVEPRKVRRAERDPARRDPPRNPVDPGLPGETGKSDPVNAAPPSVLPADAERGAIAGRAIRPDGAPLPDLAVTVTDPDGGGLAAVTGPDGAFRVDQLPPGTYTVSVQSPQNLGRLPDGAYGDRHVVVEAGRTAQVEFGALGIARASIYGLVLEEGRGVGGAYVTLVFLGATGETGPGGEGIDTKSLATDTRGEYRFEDLAPGSYTLLATHPNDPSRVARALMELPEGGDRRKDLPFSSLVLRGRVIDGRNSAPLPGVSVFLQRDDPSNDPSRMLEALVSLQVMSTFTDENGGFDFASLEPGTYVVVGSLEGYATRALPRLTLGDTAGVQEVVVEMEQGGAVLEGTVKKKSGSIPPNTYVAIRDAADNVISLRRVDRNGEFEVDGLAPGAYRAVIFSEGQSGQVRFFTVAARGVMSQEFEIP